MAGYKKLTRESEERLIVQTEELYEHGYTIDEIAEFLEQPIARVKYWIGLLTQVAKIENLIRG